MEYNWQEDNILPRKIIKILLSDTLPNGEPVSSMVLIDDASRAELQRWADMTDEEYIAAIQNGDTLKIDVDDEIKRIEEEYGLDPHFFDDLYFDPDEDCDEDAERFIYEVCEFDPEFSDEILQWEEQEDDQPKEYHFTNPDPYAKVDPLLYEQRQHNFWFGEDGHIHVKNISAYWIPELTITEKIHGTVYTVTGSYEGEETFVRKLERITSKKFAEKLEDSE